MNRSDLSRTRMATDPVCGMMVDADAGEPAYDYKNETYHFCSEGCRSKFAKEPAHFLDKKGEPEPLAKSTLYTCPMHPEIVQEGPGHCPKWGMALEPMGIPGEMGSMMRRRWPRRMSGLPWAPAPMSPWRVPGFRC